MLLLGVQCPAVRIYIQCFFKRVSHHLPAAGKQLGESWIVCTRALLRLDTDFQESIIFHGQCSMKVTLGDFFFYHPNTTLSAARQASAWGERSSTGSLPLA